MSGEDVPVALLLDGDSLSPSLAQDFITAASAFGRIAALRVYARQDGFAADWGSVAGAQVRWADPRKNAADFDLSFEAVEMALTGDWEVFVIASNDAHLAHVVHWLRRRGRRVITMSNRSMCQGLRDASPESVVLSPVESEAGDALMTRGDPVAIVERYLACRGGSALMSALGNDITAAYGLTARALGEESWKAFLQRRPDLFRFSQEKGAARLHLLDT